MNDDYDYPAFNTGKPEEELPESVIRLIGELIKRDNVQSVSCPFNNSSAWRLLVAEQIRRAALIGKPPQEVFKLSGPDGGLGFDPREWGGEVHIPYEGAAGADLFVGPEWRNFNRETKFSTLSTSYHYLLLGRDLGQLECAIRSEVGNGWFLYESTRPYVSFELREQQFVEKCIHNNLNVQKAANLIFNADSLIITAGAGMGVDSGLPDFRGKEGFWKAYPALAKANMGFTEVACPDTFVSNPRLAWGFYGHRLNLYRDTKPHMGFKYLRAISKHLDGGAFVFTSNVDGHFQKAGFPLNDVVECHGSIHHLQCQNTCNQEIWETNRFNPVVDEEHCLLTSDLPTCPSCREVARPNILMFGDWNWVNWRTEFQKARFHDWRATVRNPVVIEIGAGKSIPTVREFGESRNVPLIRINPTDAEVERADDVSIEMGALAGIKAIAKRLVEMGFVPNTEKRELL